MQDLTTLTINVKDPWKNPANGWDVIDRSEEHTSELQSPA